MTVPGVTRPDLPNPGGRFIIDEIKRLTVAALAFMSFVYTLYAVMNVLEPDVGFAIVEILPPAPVLLLLPIWSAAFARRALTSPGAEIPSGSPGWQPHFLWFPGIHLIIWWTPVVNLVMPFVALRYLGKLRGEPGVFATTLLGLWMVSWILACICPVFWPDASAMEQALFGAASAAGAATVAFVDR